MPVIPVVELLRNPRKFPHPVASIEVIETHISSVVLTGDYAYKLKKPVNLGFVDFSTLEKRKYYCEEELRLNRRFAADIYLDVVAITPNGVEAVDEAGNEVLDYAVKMRQFDRSAELDRLARENRLDKDTIRQLATTIAEFHANTSAAHREDGYATADMIRNHIEGNFRHILNTSHTLETRQLIEDLRQWVEEFFRAKEGYFDERLDSGFVRECHGDLHLANIVMIDGVATPFDCIEFDSAYRCIDQLSEIAFMMMDLDYHLRPDLARIFLDTWLQKSGDYQGLRLLVYYLVYRASVRAKVSALRHTNQKNGGAETGASSTSAYLQLAVRYAAQNKPTPIIITHGLSGCGKTYITSRLIEAIDAIRVRSDIERKRMFKSTQAGQRGSAVNSGIYSEYADGLTYDRLMELARDIAGAGYPSILDGTYLLRRRRQEIYDLAAELDVPVVILDITAPLAVLRSRIGSRLTAGKDVSDATEQVLEYQMGVAEPLDELEIESAITIDSSLDWNVQSLKRQVEKLVGCAV